MSGSESVYVATHSSGKVKIGKSKSPKRRIGALNKGVVVGEIELYHSVQAPEGVLAETIERYVHRKLSESNLDGEWFDIDKDGAVDAVEKAVDEFSQPEDERPSVGWTTVPVRKETRDRLEGHPEKSGRDWDTFLRREVLGDDIDADEAGPVAADELPTETLVVSEATEEQLAAIREQLEQVPERTADDVEERFR